MSIKINKNSKEYDLGFMPKHYSADRVYLHGNTDENAESAIDGKASKSGDTFSGHVTIDRANGTTQGVGTSNLILGNNVPSGTAGNSRGQIALYGTSAYYARLRAGALTANRDIIMPDKAGTLMITDDVSEYNIAVDSAVSNVITILQSGAYIISVGTKKLLIGNVIFRNSSNLNAWTHLFTVPSSNYNIHIVDYENHLYQYNKNGYIQNSDNAISAGDHDFSFTAVIN